MTDHQQSQQAPTAEIQQTKMNQGQEAIEQAMELQRNMAQMTLSAMQWQETAQKQGFEMTRSMLQGMVGQQLTQSMIERYLEGLETVMPEMEQALEKGLRATSQPQSTRQGGQSGSQMQSVGGQQMTSQQPRKQLDDQRMRDQQQPAQQMSDQTQQRPLPAQTGEWATQADSYGGEPSGSPPQQRPRQTATERQSGPQPQHPRSEYGLQREQAGHETQQGRRPPRQGERPPRQHQQRIDQPPSGRQQEQRNRGREFSQPPQRRQSEQPRSDRIRSQDGSTQRIDSERNGRHQYRQQQSMRREQGGRSESTGPRRSTEIKQSGGSERGADHDAEQDEMPREDKDVSSEYDRQPSDNEFDDENCSA